MDVKVDLLPCPLCGGEAVLVANPFYGDLSMAECSRCGCRAYQKKWNTRLSARSSPEREQIALAIINERLRFMGIEKRVERLSDLEPHRYRDELRYADAILFLPRERVGGGVEDREDQGDPVPGQPALVPSGPEPQGVSAHSGNDRAHQVALAYGLLWHMEIDREDDNLRLASDARKALLSVLSKDDQLRGITAAKLTDARFTGAA